MNTIPCITWRSKSFERHIKVSLDPISETFVIETVSKLEKGNWRDYLRGVAKQSNIIIDFCLRSKFKLKTSVTRLSKEATLMIWNTLGYAILESGILSNKEFFEACSKIIENTTYRKSSTLNEIQKIKDEKASDS